VRTSTDDMRSTAKYAAISYCAIGLILGHAWLTQPNFYRATAYLYNSKTARFSAVNAGLVSLYLVGQLVQRLLLGELRLVEAERLHLRARESLVEMFLAMTVFSRTDFHARFLCMFAWTFFLKVFHWLSQERLGYVEQQVIMLSRPRLTHARLVVLFCWLFVTDACMLWHCLHFTSTNGPSIMAMFAFEYAILLIGLLSQIVRYVVFIIDVFVLTEGTWDDKGLWLFYNELLSLFLQLAAYLAFFTYVHLFYSLPLHILRDLAVTARTFRQRLIEFIRYRQVVRSMHTQFPNATEQELAAGDRTCIICREEMFGGAGAKKLVCGHIFHLRCLRSWMERSMSCPTCRRDIRPLRAPTTSARPTASSGAATHHDDVARRNAPGSLSTRPQRGATAPIEAPATAARRVDTSAVPASTQQRMRPSTASADREASDPEHHSRNEWNAHSGRPPWTTARLTEMPPPSSSTSTPAPPPPSSPPPPPPPPPQLLAVLEYIAQTAPHADVQCSPLPPTSTPAQPTRTHTTPASYARPRSATIEDARRLQRQLDDLSSVMRNLIERLEHELEDRDAEQIERR